jgi:tetratricopeptide (TPR) repeat protein
MGTDDIASYEMWLDAVSADDFKEVISRDNAYIRAYTDLALATIGTYGLSLDEPAVAAVDAALALDPDSADAISLYGLDSEIRQLRIQAFERAIELDADHHLSYYRYAMEMKEAGELRVAEQLIRQALMFAPQDRRYREVLDEIVSEQD